MKILHVYKTYYPETLGGIESFITALMADLRKKSIESDLVVTTTGKQRIENNTFYFPATVTMASTPVSIAYLKNFKKLASQYDVLHYHFPWPFADLTHLLTRIKKPSILTYHSDIIKQKYLNYCYAPLMHAFLKRMHCIVATSPNYVKTSPVLQRYQNKVAVVPFGMSRTQFPVPDETELSHWREKVGDQFFLFVGVLRYYKGLDYLLTALENTNIPLVIAGTGPEERRLKLLAQQKKLSHVHFVGYVDDHAKAALYQLCKAVVSPSHLRSEAFCLSLLEGLVFEKPLISTDIGTGTSFVNKEGVTGRVVPPANPMALREAMMQLQKNNSCFQSSSRQYYEAHFLMETMVARYVALYQDCLRD